MKTLTLLGAVLLSGSRVIAQSPATISGAWELIGTRNITAGTPRQSPDPVLHVIFNNGQYVQFSAGANRPKTTAPIADLPREALLERFRGIQGQYGTYRVEGSKLMRHIVSAANPNTEGRDTSEEIIIEGETLTLTFPNAQGQIIEDRFQRLSGG
jgi:hypothetical protein